MSHLRWGNSQINVNFKGSRLLILWAQVDAAGDNGWQLLWDAAAAAAQLCQSCLTLCDPIEGSPPGSPSLGFSRQDHWSGLPFPSPMHESEKWKWSRSVVSDSVTPWTAAYQAPPSFANSFSLPTCHFQAGPGLPASLFRPSGLDFPSESLPFEP